MRAWERVERVGDVDVEAGIWSRSKISVWTKGPALDHAEWHAYFNSQISMLRIDPAYDGTSSGDRYRISGSTADDDLEEYVETIDSVIDHANHRYEEEVLPTLQAHKIRDDRHR